MPVSDGPRPAEQRGAGDQGAGEQRGGGDQGPAASLRDAAADALSSLVTERLELRRPVVADLESFVALHTDLRLYEHAPYARLTDDQAHVSFERLLAAWARDGFGYWTVVDRAAGERVGIAGVRPDGPGRLNLYYRFDRSAHGRGLAREAARTAVVAATEWLPGRVEALAKDRNLASSRTARSAGLWPLGADRRLDDPAGSGPSTRFAAPSVERVDQLGDDAREELLDLWCRVTEGGGSVGFVPGAPRGRVADALAGHESQMAAGTAFGLGLRLPSGVLAGWAWWVLVANPLLAHGRWLYRLMVDPAHQGRNLGAILMAGAHREARADGAELLQLGYRSGSGLGDFYARFGYAEVGRIPGAIRVAAGDDRDDVTMARRVDGARLRGDGRR